MISDAYAIFSRRILGSVAWVLMCLMLLVGCFSPPDVKDLEGRARQYLVERQKRDRSAVYDDFLDPEVRAGFPKGEFLRRRGGAFDLLSFSIKAAIVNPESSPREGRVEVVMKAVIPLLTPDGGSQTVRRELSDPQAWVVRDGIWYVRLKR